MLFEYFQVFTHKIKRALSCLLVLKKYDYVGFGIIKYIFEIALDIVIKRLDV